MPTIAETNRTSSQAEEQIAEAVGRSFDRAFSRTGANRKVVLSTFEAALEGLRKANNPELKLKGFAKSAALSTGRCHGNVVDTGRYLLDQVEAIAQKHGFKEELVREQFLLGLAEGACQLGPVVYCRFLEVANTYKEEADLWIARNRRLPMIFEPGPLPVIVPYESSLTINPVEPESTLETREIPAAEIPATEQQWTSPKRKTFFRRLSDAVGYWFGS
ncbi:MAG: hypothetical protein WC314_01730 [Vulcanimicrobiota bacterium]